MHPQQYAPPLAPRPGAAVVVPSPLAGERVAVRRWLPGKQSCWRADRRPPLLGALAGAWTRCDARLHARELLKRVAAGVPGVPGDGLVERGMGHFCHVEVAAGINPQAV